MRIGLITDSHIAWENKQLPPRVAAVFKEVDLILHAGDIYAHAVLDYLGNFAPVLAAQGDDDYPGLDARIKDKQVLSLEGLTLWLVHERPYNLARSSIQQENSTPAMKPDIVVFGHEHRVVVERTGGVLYVNSGSPTLLHYRPGAGTVGILDLKAGQAEVEIVQL